MSTGGIVGEWLVEGGGVGERRGSGVWSGYAGGFGGRWGGER